jgi:hypothetical protein
MLASCLPLGTTVRVCKKTRPNPKKGLLYDNTVTSINKGIVNDQNSYFSLPDEEAKQINQDVEEAYRAGNVILLQDHIVHLRGDGYRDTPHIHIPQLNRLLIDDSSFIRAVAYQLSVISHVRGLLAE